MKQGFQGAATLLLTLAIVGVVGLQAHQAGPVDEAAPGGLAASDAKAVYEICKLPPADHAPSALPRTQAPQWLQQNQADIERCLRGQRYAATASQPHLADARLALKAQR